MITVKFFGLVSVEANVRQLTVQEGTVRQILNEIKEKCPEFSEQQIIKSVMFVNKEQVSGHKRFSIVLKDGDELALLSPLCGG
jgi:molybdopterin converting factor small subunit